MRHTIFPPLLFPRTQFFPSSPPLLLWGSRSTRQRVSRAIMEDSFALQTTRLWFMLRFFFFPSSTTNFFLLLRFGERRCRVEIVFAPFRVIETCFESSRRIKTRRRWKWKRKKSKQQKRIFHKHPHYGIWKNCFSIRKMSQHRGEQSPAAFLCLSLQLHSVLWCCSSLSSSREACCSIIIYISGSPTKAKAESAVECEASKYFYDYRLPYNKCDM